MTRLSNAFFIVCGLLASAACHPGPVLPVGKSNVGGTIAGIVSSVGKAPEPGRKVTATNVETGERFEAITGVNGGYTIQVPEGHYRLEVELRRLPFRQAARKPCEASLCALSCIHLNCCGEQTFTLPPHFLCEIARKYLSTLVRN